MKQINDLLKKYHLKPHRYIKSGKVFIIDTDNGRFVMKNKKDLSPVYHYLSSRAFTYYPEDISEEEDSYAIFPYVEDYDIPKEQKMVDMIDLVSLLHNKTTHYKEIDEEEYKKIYEDLMNNIAYLESYYNDIITIAESKVYMSPSEYLFARNITKIFSALQFCKENLEKWYEKVKKIQKKRLTVVHNNLSSDHFIRNENSYLISWDHAKVDLPIFDLYKLYQNEGLEIEFSSLLKRYEKNYPLLEEERELLFILISMPAKVSFIGTEYQKCVEVTKMIDSVYKTESIISPYYTEEEKTE